MAPNSTIPDRNNGKPENTAQGLKRFSVVQEEAKTPGQSKIFTDYYIAIYLFLIAGFAAAAVFIHRPMIKEIQRINKETQNRLTTIENERAYLNSIEGSVAAAQSIPPEVLEQVDKSLPREQDIPSLLVQFGAAAAANSVNIESIAFVETKGAEGQTTPQGLVVPMDVNLVVRAPSYFEMKRFLTAVENSLRLMDVQSINLSGGDLKEISFSIQLKVYTYQPPAGRQAQAAGASASTTPPVVPVDVPAPKPKS
jgi:Tfp pilus assembly protein PilO